MTLDILFCKRHRLTSEGLVNLTGFIRGENSGQPAPRVVELDLLL